MLRRFRIQELLGLGIGVWGESNLSRIVRLPLEGVAAPVSSLGGGVGNPHSLKGISSSHLRTLEAPKSHMPKLLRLTQLAARA